MRKECKGGEIQPMSQERIHGGGKQGRAAVTCSPDCCGMHSLIGVIDPPRLLWYFSGWPKRAFNFPVPNKAYVPRGTPNQLSYTFLCLPATITDPRTLKGSSKVVK